MFWPFRERRRDRWRSGIALDGTSVYWFSELFRRGGLHGCIYVLDCIAFFVAIFRCAYRIYFFDGGVGRWVPFGEVSLFWEHACCPDSGIFQCSTKTSSCPRRRGNFGNGIPIHIHSMSSFLHRLPVHQLDTPLVCAASCIMLSTLLSDYCTG